MLELSLVLRLWKIDLYVVKAGRPATNQAEALYDV